MPRSQSYRGDRSTQLHSEAASSFRRYQQASTADRHRADISIISQLGKKRTAMWSRWIAELGGNLEKTEGAERSVTLTVPPPPEPPSALVDDIVLLRNEIGRELLKAWAKLGRLALKEASGQN